MVLLVVVLAACGTARTQEVNLASCPTWKDDVGPELAARCQSCHGGATPAGGIDLSTYTSTIGGPARVAIGRVLDPATATGPHQGLTSLHPMLSRWAGECKVSYLRSSIHAGGLLDPESTEFHGSEVARRGSSLELCASCHGADYTGGKAKSACTTCHTEPKGPEACTTCHGQPPASGAHLAHASSPTLNQPIACSECHKVPASHNATDHVRLADGTPDLAPAELTFGDLAAATLDPAARKGAPAFNHDSGTCSNTFCHGDALAGGGTLTRPVWNGGASQAACGTCHGSPPPGPHPQDPDCARCHVSQVHINAVIDVGQSCTDCHGSETRPLSGAHRSHIEALHRLSAPIACAECHTVPATVGAAGHLDPAPAEVVFGPLAKARGATPVLTNGTCTGTACHGVATVDWRPGLGVAVCSSCHTIPPAEGKYHTAGLKLTDCVTCHAASVDAFGNIIFNGGATTHINGRTDLVAP